jgi:hypothetical protein
MAASPPAPRFLRYPRGRVLAVVDDAGAVEALAAALALAGFDPARVEAYRGESAASAFDGTGARNGLVARLRRTVEFLMMDQAPDLAWYEAAAREGRTVISVRPHGDATVARAVAILREHGAHFINHFGLLATEEFDRWRGREPHLPEYLMR